MQQGVALAVRLNCILHRLNLSDQTEASFSQSYVEIRLFPLDEAFISSPVNNPFHNCSLRDSFRNDVRNEESWLVITLGCSDAACCCSHRRGAAAGEGT